VITFSDKLPSPLPKCRIPILDRFADIDTGGASIRSSDPLAAQVIAARFKTTKALLAGMSTTTAFPPIDLQGKHAGGITPPHKGEQNESRTMGQGSGALDVDRGR
jgi:hypothetical protein